MKKTGMALLLVLFLASNVYAASYKGIYPGFTNKDEVAGVLGPPIEEIERGVEYNYPTEGRDAKKITVTFRKNAVKTVKIFFKKNYRRELLYKWFDLSDPERFDWDDESNWTEYFNKAGISLHHVDRSIDSGVQFMRFYDPQDQQGDWFQRGRDLFAQEEEEFLRERRTAPKLHQKKGRKAAVGKFSFFGAQIAEYDGKGVRILNVMRNSPARNAGFRDGDIILKIEDCDLDYSGVIPSEFVDAIKSMPVDIPLNFVVLRGAQQFNVTASLVEKSKEELAALHKDNAQEAKALFTQGREALARKDYRAAIRLYREGITYFPHADYYKALGDVYFKLGEHQKGVLVYEQALLLKTDPEAYLRLGEIYAELRQFDQALISLEKARRLTDNPDKNVRLLEALGMCHFYKGNIDAATGYCLKAFRASRKRSALGAFYLAASLDKNKNIRDAIYYYNSFLKLKSKDEKREVFARTRVKALRNNPQYKQRKEKSRSTWMNVVGQVVGGMQSSGSEEASYPPRPAPAANYPQEDNSWDNMWSNPGQDTSQYDDVFTLPPL